MEMKVQQIWHVLSGYEESSAALIGDMLRAVNQRQLLDIILLAERFILYVEVLFAVIDDLEAQFALAGVKGALLPKSAHSLTVRHVSCTGSKAFMQTAGQPSLSHVADLAEYARSLYFDHTTSALSQDPHQSRSHRRDQVGAGYG